MLHSTKREKSEGEGRALQRGLRCTQDARLMSPGVGDKRKGSWEEGGLSVGLCRSSTGVGVHGDA